MCYGYMFSLGHLVSLPKQLYRNQAVSFDMFKAFLKIINSYRNLTRFLANKSEIATLIILFIF